MMYPYMMFSDDTEVLHSQIIEYGGKQTVEVHFERPTDIGFDMARCRLPDYEWIKCDGYTTEEILYFEEFLRSNAHLLYKYAANGGISIA